MKKILSEEEIGKIFNKALEVPDLIKELSDYELSELKQYAHLKLSNLETELEEASDFFNKGFPQEYIDKYKIHSLNGHLKEMGERGSYSGHVEELLTVIEDEIKKRKLPPEIPGQSLIEAYYKKLKESPAFISRLDEFLMTEILTYAKEQAAQDMLWEPGKHNFDEAVRRVDSIIQQYKADGALNTNDFLSDIAKDWGHDVREWFSVILLLTNNLQTKSNYAKTNRAVNDGMSKRRNQVYILYFAKLYKSDPPKIDLSNFSKEKVKELFNETVKKVHPESSADNFVLNIRGYKDNKTETPFYYNGEGWLFNEKLYNKMELKYPEENKEAEDLIKIIDGI